MKRIFAAILALVTVLTLSGCMALEGEGNFHGDRGDLVNSDGTVRYVGWCELHPHNANCTSQSPGPA